MNGDAAVDLPAASDSSDVRGPPEPVAVIGLGCRFPGANDPQRYWALLRAGEDAIREVPPERWDLERHFSDDPRAEGKMNSRYGGFLEGIDRFDHGFFGISAKEAARLDPQQRLMLEVTWEAFEDAGIPAEKLAGSRTGVFVGSLGSEYDWLQARDLRLVTAYSPTGSAQGVIANRVSYTFDLTGPSVTVDSACSASLVAIATACRSIWSGESDQAVAGGVAVMVHPGPTVGMSKLTALAPDGRCKAFDARANGYVRSEGAGAVVLKPLARALVDGDRIYAIVRGYAVNNDGKTNGLTAPNRRAQERLLRDAYASARVAPASVQYVEAHGTGTLLGDPIECSALGAVLGAGRETPLLVGSVKTNIGHMEGAAGVGGFIKLCLMLERREIPPSIHYEKPNPHIPFEKLNLEVVTAHRPWPEARPARAGVSAFGFGGTNCHLVLEEPPETARRPEVSSAPRDELLVLSAKSPEALLAQARAMGEFLAAAGAPAPQSICRTAAVNRTHHEHRAFAVGSDAATLRERLLALAGGHPGPQAGRGRAARSRRPKIAFIFPGLGPQWRGMAQALLRDEPVFRQTVERVDASVFRSAHWRVLEELEGERAGEGLESAHIEKIQTTLFAVQVGLAALWRSCGIEPQAVVGHSMGEVAAAVTASVLTIEDAARLMLGRSRLLHQASGTGAMAMVELPLADAESAIAGHEDTVSVAANNSPGTTVLSGDAASLQKILVALEARGVAVRPVRTTGVAGHSPQLEGARRELIAALEGLCPAEERLPIYSTLLGERTSGERFDATYWGDQLRRPVHFARAVERLRADGFDTFLELSPHPVLAEDVRRCFAAHGAEALVLPSMRRNESERAVMLAAVGRLHAAGATVALSSLFPRATRPVALPCTAWQKSRAWLEMEGDGTEGEAALASDGLRVRDEAVLQQIQSDAWTYGVSWRKTPSPAVASPGGVSGSWLVVGDNAVATEVAAGLRSRGANAVEAVPARDLTRQGPMRWGVPIADEGAVSALLGALATSDGGACRGVLYLAALDAPALGDAHDGAAGECIWGGLLAFAKALATASSSDGPRLWVATAGAQSLGSENAPGHPLHALAWGLGRVLANESPGTWGGLLDLDPAASDAQNANALLSEWLAAAASPGSSAAAEDQVAIRGGERHVARLTRAALARRASGPPAIRRDAAYLVTGGLGALGLLWARALAERGARRLILLARTAMPPRERWLELGPSDPHFAAAQAILAMEKAGAHVRVESLDVADGLALQAFVERYRREGHPPIAGVFHCAGVLRDGIALHLNRDSFLEVLRPKVEGALNLDRAFASTALDHFVLFSSAAGLLGSPGQGNYAAANAFLDALAQARRAAARPGLSIAWGPWSEAGLAHRPDRAGRLALRGMKGLASAAGIAVLDRLLKRDPPPVTAVLDATWGELFAAYDDLDERPFYSELRAEAPREAKAPVLDAGSLRALPPDARRDAVLSHLKALLGRAFGCAPETLDAQQPMNQMGLDSLIVLELSSRLKQSLGVAPALELFAHGGSPQDLAAHLLEQLGLEKTSPAAPRAASRGDWIVRPLPRPAATARAFCFAYAGASPYVFQGLARALPEQVELCMVQLPGRGTRGGEPLADRIAALSGPLVDALAPALDKPFGLFGYSVGGLLAFETARALRRGGMRLPESLVIAASRAPQLPDPAPEVRALPDDRFAEALRRFGGTPAEVLVSPEMMKRVLPVLRADFALIQSYEYREELPLECPIAVHGGARDEVVPVHDLRPWESLSARFTLTLFPDEGHFFLKSREHALARAITDAVLPVSK